jgi:serine/threonine-protein kinase
MGIVYLARRVSDGKSVAVKTIRPGVTASHHEMSQFLREARILEQLRHPKIVSFLASGEAGDSLFFVMDYVEGTNALQLLRHEGPLPIGRAVGLVCQALEALAYAHGQGFVHRDVKPSNLLVGLGDDCKLADFGLARAYQCSALSGLTMMGDVGGSIPYMPPEQITHYRDARPPADQYAAAATLYHLLTGRLIFDFGNASNQRKLAQILCEEPIPIRTRRPNIPSPLAAAIHQALSKEPEKRFPSVTHFAKAILDSIPRPTC